MYLAVSRDQSHGCDLVSDFIHSYVTAAWQYGTYVSRVELAFGKRRQIRAPGASKRPVLVQGHTRYAELRNSQFAEPANGDSGTVDSQYSYQA